ncbi:ABC transporter substrate-binding protein [Breznakiella homolactica]|uniref:Extracellular solute-binding protein n=1 Tax=Breznakiella homolactica TaxID=2798577 RepID=A0A7T8BCD8_9SPIR|nr:extracellular solute-binding protein [Breznakiella homolactica]QQO11030.1 extracellular solute-binding protein [Breznakiella homolactica]
MKRTIGAAAALLLLAVVLIGCGKPKDNAAASGGKIKLQYWTWLSNQAAVEEFNSSQDKYEVEHVQMAHGDIMNKLTVALSANAGAPDIFQMTQRHFSNYTTTGKLYDMTAAAAGVISQFPESLQELVSLNGKVYGLAADISPAVLWYRTDIFEKYGIKTIDTWDQYNEAAAVLKKDGIYIMPIFNPAGAWGTNAIAMFLGTRGGNIFTADGKVIQNNRELEFVLQYFYDMNKKGYGESITFFTPEFWGELKAGKIASWPMNMAEGANIKKNMPELSGQWGIMAIPRWNDKTEQLTGFWGGTVLSVPDQSPHKEGAAEFVKWLCATNEGQLAASKTWNAVPALPSAYENSFYTQGDPYFSGDNAYSKINDSTPFYYYDWSIVEKVVGEQLDLMFADKITPAQARAAIEKNIAAETKR